MVMDWGARELPPIIGGHRPGDQGIVGILKSEDPGDFLDQDNLLDLPFLLPAASNDVETPPTSASPQGYSPEDSEIFSDIALSYISEMLMEEEMDDKLCIGDGPSALEAAVEPFIDALGDTSPEDSSGQGADSSDAHRDFLFDFGCPQDPQFPEISGLEEHQFLRPVIGSDPSYDEIRLVQEYRRGVEEASKFLPDQNRMAFDIQRDPMLQVKLEEEEKSASAKSRKKNLHHDDPNPDKKPDDEEEDLGGRRSSKQSALSPSDDDVSSELFDKVLLCPQGRPNDAISALRKLLQSEVSKGHHAKSHHRSRSKKKNPKRDVVDLRTLLIHCAQAVAADDRRTAQELLKQIRSHASPLGDGSQRLAVCFADGLEARLAGTGTEIYHSLLARNQSAAATLKAYHLYLAACPFKKISHFVSNQTILNVAEGSSSLHIIDFGILFGFQWPCLIQRLSMRPGGPPKLKITGIEQPQPGFRPNERILETGRRLKGYADMFNVPFEYTAIAAKFEDIKIEDFNLAESGEVLIVNCLYRFRNLVDETVLAGNPRDEVLRTIRKMNPDLFIHGVVNGSYGAPFFVTRFREALFHFSALFDMLEATVPREHPERLLIEREIFGREAMNVVACEGVERVERPETYRQWQGRNTRAGFKQVRLDGDMVRKARDKVGSCYDKEFLIDEDGGWLLQGWKGRIIHAISAWRPNPR